MRKLRTASSSAGERKTSPSGVCDWYFDTQNSPATKLPNDDNVEIKMAVRDTTLRSGIARNAMAALHCNQSLMIDGQDTWDARKKHCSLRTTTIVPSQNIAPQWDRTLRLTNRFESVHSFTRRWIWRRQRSPRRNIVSNSEISLKYRNGMVKQMRVIATMITMVSGLEYCPSVLGLPTFWKPSRSSSPNLKLA
jgi:hypothetical protein